MKYQIKLEAGLEANSTIWRYDVKKMLISYEDKKKTKKKIVLVLKAMYHERQLSSEQQSKPQPIDYYDHIKGGADIINLLSCMVSTRVSFWQKLNMEVPEHAVVTSQRQISKNLIYRELSII